MKEGTIADHWYKDILGKMTIEVVDDSANTQTGKRTLEKLSFSRQCAAFYVSTPKESFSSSPLVLSASNDTSNAGAAPSARTQLANLTTAAAMTNAQRSTKNISMLALKNKLSALQVLNYHVQHAITTSVQHYQHICDVCIYGGCTTPVLLQLANISHGLHVAHSML